MGSDVGNKGAQLGDGEMSHLRLAAQLKVGCVSNIADRAPPIGQHQAI